MVVAISSLPMVEIEEAIEKSMSLPEAANMLKVELRDLRRYVGMDAALRRAAEEQKLRIMDLAQERLVDALRQGEWRAVEFALKTLGKEQGFSERKEVAVGVIQHVFDHASAVASIASGPAVHSLPPGANEGGSDGEAVGENLYGGHVRVSVSRPRRGGRVGGANVPQREDAVEVR